jgi:hypothetical protein
MSVKPLDTLLAIKIIGLMPGLLLSDRQVGILLFEHYNRQTGRCDPGIERLSALLGLSTRTIMRSTKRLEAARLFNKARHGGYSRRNSYGPNWPRFAELLAAWNKRLKFAAKSRGTGLSPSERHTSHVEPDGHVTQTYKANLPKKTYRDSRESNKRTPTPATPQRLYPVRVTDPADAATVTAERRWMDDLHRQFSSMPMTYGEIIEAIDPQMRAAATQAEMKRRGAGLDYIVCQLKLGRAK